MSGRDSQAESKVGNVFLLVLRKTSLVIAFRAEGEAQARAIEQILSIESVDFVLFG